LEVPLQTRMAISAQREIRLGTAEVGWSVAADGLRGAGAAASFARSIRLDGEENVVVALGVAVDGKAAI